MVASRSHSRVIAHPRRRVVGFTIVELLITITIVACIAIVAYVSAQGYIKRSHNSVRIADIAHLQDVLREYAGTYRTLPDPRSNAIYYDTRGVYAHSSIGSYGISGYLSRDLLGAKYTNTNMLDPETKQYYAYGKRTDQSAFDLATVLYEDGEYRAYLRGTYDGKDLVSLIRAYASSDFVSDGSVDALPYNPIERKITARIESWSGIVLVNDTTSSLTGELNTGDRISVSTGGLALLSISDGSELSLGSSSGSSLLDLSSLQYSDDHNLVSRVALFLRSGEVSVRAPRLRETAEERSEFSIQSDTAVAAVRGTVFGMRSDPVNHTTDILLSAGRIEAMEKWSSEFINPADQADRLTPLHDTRIFSSASGSYTYEDGRTYMQTTEWSGTLRLEIVKSEGGISSQTGALDDDYLREKFAGHPFSTAYHPQILSLKSSTGSLAGNRTLSARFKNPGADRYRLRFIPENTTPGVEISPSDTTASSSGTIDATSWSGSVDMVIPDGAGELGLILCHGSDYARICSAETLTHIRAGTFDLSDLSLGWERLRRSGDTTPSEPESNTGTETTPACPTGQRIFASFWCQDEHLVAYAPYDTAGDYRMYTADLALHLPLIQSGTLGYGFPRILETTPNHYEFANTGAWRTNSGIDNAIDTRLQVWKLTNPGLFYDWNKVATGILIPNNTGGVANGERTSLRYDLGELNLGENYRIEFSVRGGALKRNASTTTYWLASSGPATTNTNSANFKASLSSRGLSVCRGSDITNCSIISPSQIASLLLQESDFYTIRYEKTIATGALSIVRNAELYAQVNTTTPAFLNVTYPTSRVHLFMGSGHLGSSQWNDIINFVKIYRLP